MTQSVTELGLPTPKERRRLREAADLTHDEVAAAVGVTSNTVRSWETGRTHPRGRKREAYAKLLARLAADQAPQPGRSAPAAADQPRPDWTVGTIPGADSDPHPNRPDTGHHRADGPAAAGQHGADGPITAGQHQADGPVAGQHRADAAGPAPAAGARLGSGAVAPTRPSWANSTVTDAPAAPKPGNPGAETPERATARTAAAPDASSAAAAASRATSTDTAPASAARTASGFTCADTEQAAADACSTGTDRASAADPATGSVPTSADGPSAVTTPPPASAAGAPADQDGASTDADLAADAAGSHFGLRMRGLTRPVAAQTRPKAAVKRAAKPPVGVPRHETKATVKTGAGGGGGSSAGAGLNALRPGGPVTPGPETDSSPGPGPDADTDTARDTGPGTAPGTGTGMGTAQGTGTAMGTGTGTAPAPGNGTAPATALATGTGTGTAPATGTALATGTATGTGTGTAPATAPGTGTGPAPGTGPTPGTAPVGGGHGGGVPGPGPRTAPQDTTSPVSAFDALYNRTAPALTRQAYLLTGRRALAHEAVERAFQQAWERWPEVATDPDPVGWVRAAAYEYALSPWHQLRRGHRHADKQDKPPADPADRVLMDAMLALPPAHRRTVLLYDGVGLDLPDTAAETEASTPTAGNRLVNAHADLADQIPELADTEPGKQSALLRERLGSLTPAVRLEPRAAAVVRVAGEHRTRRWTRAVVGVTALIAAATAYTVVTAPTEYEPPRAPGASVSGVPPHSGPQQLSDQGRQLHDKLLSDPSAGTARIAPSLE
ncbi:helix-turn-helix domain-containing protein [Streptomyces sp. NBC_00096]|uniref:helix-turn-helix domain-containing protein n=1 Tax=Streptomyces sp. NBC_00096 TaxID=2975650 RepID=UPI00386395DA